MARPEQEPDVDHCPTCDQALYRCGQVWPPSVHDVEPVRCSLPLGHRSAEHWHPRLWPGTADLLWFDDEPTAVTRPRRGRSLSR